MLRGQVVFPCRQHSFQFFFRTAGFQDIFQNRIKYLVSHLQPCGVEVHISCQVDKAVADYFRNLSFFFLVQRISIDIFHASVFDLLCQSSVNLLILFHQNFSGVRINYIIGCHYACNSV